MKKKKNRESHRHSSATQIRQNATSHKYFDSCIVHIIVSVVKVHDASNRENYDGNCQREYGEFLICRSIQYDEELYVRCQAEFRAETISTDRRARAMFLENVSFSSPEDISIERTVRSDV